MTVRPWKDHTPSERAAYLLAKQNPEHARSYALSLARHVRVTPQDGRDFWEQVLQAIDATVVCPQCASAKSEVVELRNGVTTTGFARECSGCRYEWTPEVQSPPVQSPEQPDPSSPAQA